MSTVPPVRELVPRVEKNRRLEAMRAIACLLVLANHITANTAGLPRPMPVTMVLNVATEAVVFFFVLSGAVIAHSAPHSISRYLEARAVRIIPIYLVSLGLTVAVMILAGRAVRGTDLLGNLLFLQTLPGFIVTPLAYNMPAWSLSYEVAFYILFAAFIRWPQAAGPAFGASLLLGLTLHILPPESGLLAHLRHTGAFAAFWLSGLFAARAAAAGWRIEARDAAGLFLAGFSLSRVPLSEQYYDFFRLLSFATGSAALCLWALAQTPDRVSPRRPREIRVPLALHAGLMLGADAALWLISPSHLAAKLVITAGFAFYLFGWDGIQSIGRVFYGLGEPVLVRIAGFSYALYIVHAPVICFFEWQCAQSSPYLRVALAVASSVMLAHILDCELQPRIKARLLGRPAVRPGRREA